MTTMEELNGIFRMVFADETIEIKPEMTANDIDGWDSLSHVNLITVVEVKFGIRFTQKELRTLKNVGDLLKAIQSNVA
jgi:acyl carrier protein